MENQEVKSIAILFDTTSADEMQDPTTEATDNPEGSFNLETEFCFLPLVERMPSTFIGKYFAVGSEEIYTLYGVTGNGMVKEIYKSDR